MVNVYKKFIGSILGGKGQVALLLIILAAAAATKFTLAGTAGINLDQLGFTSSVALDTGIVVYSDSRQVLILDQGRLYRRSGEELRIVAQDVVNFLTHEGRFWIKTKTQIAELILSNGAVLPHLFASSPECRGFPFAEARLVGTRKQRYYLSSNLGILGIAQGAAAEGPYFLEGRRSTQLVEHDWSQGVVFTQDYSWTVYVNYIEQQKVQLDYALGELQDAVLSPDSSTLVYVVQQGNWAEVWHAQVTGSEAELLYRWEMQFSSLEALWAPDLSLAAVSVLGYEDDAGFSDNFHSATFLFQPQQGTAMLNKSYGTEIKALVPTAWDAGEYTIWFNWLHEENPQPVSYSLFRQ